MSRAEAKSTSGWDACEAADADRATRDTIAATFTPTPRLVARLLEARGPVEKFDVLLRAGWWSAWDTALAAARVEREDPSAYAGRRAIRRSMRDRVYRDAIAAIADRRPHEFGHRYDLLLSQGIDLNHVIHYHKSQRLPVAGAAADPLVAAIIEATGGDSLSDAADALRGTDRSDADPRAVVGALVALYGQGRSPSTFESSADPGVFVIRAGRWHLGSRQLRAAAGVGRAERTERERRARGLRTSVVPSSEIDASPKGGHDAVLDLVDGMDAVRAIKAVAAGCDKPREAAACHHLLTDVPLAEAARRFGVSLQSARTGKAAVIARMKRAVGD